MLGRHGFVGGLHNPFGHARGAGRDIFQNKGTIKIQFGMEFGMHPNPKQFRTRPCQRPRRYIRDNDAIVQTRNTFPLQHQLGPAILPSDWPPWLPTKGSRAPARHNQPHIMPQCTTQSWHNYDTIYDTIYATIHFHLGFVEKVCSARG